MRGSITQARDKAIKLMLIKIMYKSLVTHSKCHNIFSPLFFHFRFLRFVRRSLCRYCCFSHSARSFCSASSRNSVFSWNRCRGRTENQRTILYWRNGAYCSIKLRFIIAFGYLFLQLCTMKRKQQGKTQILAFHTKCRQDKNVATWAKTTTARREGKWREKKA